MAGQVGRRPRGAVTLTACDPWLLGGPAIDVSEAIDGFPSRSVYPKTCVRPVSRSMVSLSRRNRLLR